MCSASISLWRLSLSELWIILLHILVSSAYSAKFVPGLMQDRISFMNKTKRRGPSMEPWGTPELTGTLLDLSPPITTHWVLFCRYDLMKFNMVPSTLYWYLSFWRIISWFTVSKALAKSKYITSVLDWSWIVIPRSSTNGIICVLHDFNGINPCWLSCIKCLQDDISSFLIHFSNIFIVNEVRDIGL